MDEQLNDDVELDEDDVDLQDAADLDEDDVDLQDAADLDEDDVVEGKTESLPSGTMVMCDDGVERPVITREQAIADVTNRYFTGIVCRNGHMVERKVKGYVCTTCSRNRQKARKKLRASEDPAFKQKLATKRAEKHKSKYKDNPEYRQKVLDRAKARRVRNAATKRLAKAEAEVTAPTE